jgi:hypothetical protein
MNENTNLAATVAAIERAFEGRWAVWLSDSGWWWATRTRSLSPREIAVGCIPFVQADDPGELTERIRQQDLLTT